RRPGRERAGAATCRATPCPSGCVLRRGRTGVLDLREQLMQRSYSLEARDAYGQPAVANEFEDGQAAQAVAAAAHDGGGHEVVDRNRESLSASREFEPVGE